MRGNFRRHLAVLLAYVGLSLLLTWPLILHFGSHVPGDGIDDPSLAWNLWWVKHSLVDQLQNPFACNWIFWPVGINLAFYTLTILNGLLSVPLQPVLGTISAYNLLLLSSFVLGGYGAFLLCLEALGSGQQAKRAENAIGGGSRLLALPSSPTSSFAMAAFLGGCLYAFASSKLFYASLGQGNIASSQWVPFAALYILRATRPAGRTRDATLAALFLVLQAYAEQTYASFLLIFALLAVMWGLVCAMQAGRRRPGVPPGARRRLAPFVLRLALLGALSLFGIAPFLANMLPDLRVEGDFFTAGGGFADLYSADLVGFVLPTQLHPLLGGAIRQLAYDSATRPDGTQFPVNKGQQVYIGYSALLLSAAGLVSAARRTASRRAAGLGLASADPATDPLAGNPVGPAVAPSFPGPWFWSVSTLCFFLLCLGPSLRVAGHDLGVPLPFALVAQLPFFKGNRYPSRYSVMLLLSLAPLVSLGSLRILESLGILGVRSWAHRPGLRWAGYSFVVVLLLFEHLSVPLPLSDLRVPALYARVAQTPGDFALLEIPPGWRNGARVAGKQDIVIMQEQWYQTYHGKRVLGGNTSRNPEFKFQYFSEDPTLARLIGQTNAADLPQHTALRSALAANKVTDAERKRAVDWAAFLNLRFVMVHRDKIPPETEIALQSLLPVKLAGADGNLALYELPSDLPRLQAFDLDADQGSLALAEGWSPPTGGAGRFTDPVGQSPVYAERSESRLLLPLDKSATSIRLFAWAPMAGQTLSLVVDGRSLPAQPLPQTPGWLAVPVPADPARPPLSDVRLRFARLASPSEVAPGPWPAGSTGVFASASILVRSAGQETGDFGHIYVNGRDVAQDRRGYNLVALSGDGQVLDSVAFDTHLDAEAGARLAVWVRGLPAGTLVAGAVRDEASMNLGDEAAAALQSLGVQDDLRGHFRWGQAFIGAAGALPGSALEAIDGLRPAQVSLGLPVSAPSVAAAVVRVEVGN
jgi:hypothetical protein